MLIRLLGRWRDRCRRTRPNQYRDGAVDSRLRDWGYVGSEAAWALVWQEFSADGLDPVTASYLSVSGTPERRTRQQCRTWDNHPKSLASAGRLPSVTGPAASAAFHSPNGVAADGLGNLVIAISSDERVRRVDLYGTITSVVGDTFWGRIYDLIAASFLHPSGVAGGRARQCLNRGRWKPSRAKYEGLPSRRARPSWHIHRGTSGG